MPPIQVLLWINLLMYIKEQDLHSKEHSPIPFLVKQFNWIYPMVRVVHGL